MPLDFTFLNAITREKFIPGLQNQLYYEMPLLKEIVNNGIEDATGRKLLKDVVLARNAAGGQVSGYGYVTTQGNNLVTQATLDYSSIYYDSVSISKDEEMMNSGSKEKLIDMLTTKMEAAKMTLKERVYSDLYASNTVNANGEFTLVGLQAVISESNTYANINRSTAGNEGWKSNVFSTATTLAELKNPTSATKYFPTIIRTLALRAANDKFPSLAVTTTTLYEVLEFIGETANLRFIGNVANFAFDEVRFGKQGKKGAPELVVTWDKYAPAYKLFVLTPERFKAFIFSGANFEPADVLGTGVWLRGQNQLAASMQIIWKGQILCEVPREQAMATNLGAS